jgi:Ca2+:H+ antiporter
MPPPEQTPLLNCHGRQSSSPPFYLKIVALLKAEGEPSWLDSYRWFIFGSWWNLLLLLTPVAAAAHYLNWDAPLRFGLSFVTIMPLAMVCNLISRLFHDLHVILIPPQLVCNATKEMSLSFGDTLTGLSNATFGNAIEIIVGIVALLRGEVRIVQTAVCTRLDISVPRTFTGNVCR